MRFTKITDWHEPTPEQKQGWDNLCRILGGFEEVDSVVLDVYRVLEKHRVLQSESAGKELLRLAMLALPNWLRENQQKTQSVSSAETLAESSR